MKSGDVTTWQYVNWRFNRQKERAHGENLEIVAEKRVFHELEERFTFAEGNILNIGDVRLCPAAEHAARSFLTSTAQV